MRRISFCDRMTAAVTHLMQMSDLTWIREKKIKCYKKLKDDWYIQQTAFIMSETHLGCFTNDLSLKCE